MTLGTTGCLPTTLTWSTLRFREMFSCCGSRSEQTQIRGAVSLEKKCREEGWGKRLVSLKMVGGHWQSLDFWDEFLWMFECSWGTNCRGNICFGSVAESSWVGACSAVWAYWGVIKPSKGDHHGCGQTKKLHYTGLQELVNFEDMLLRCGWRKELKRPHP